MLNIMQRDVFPVFDFDKTLFETSVPSPNGVNVSVACAYALDLLFDTKGLFMSMGGLKNRAPIELIRDLLAIRPTLGPAGHDFYVKNQGRLARLSSTQLHPWLEEKCVELLAEAFVRLKLEMLLAEIGSEWPKPCVHVDELLVELHARGKPFGIISSGHDVFISRCLDQCRMPQAAIMLTDDDLRRVGGPVEKKFKPSAALICYFDVKMYISRLPFKRAGYLYFGDDAIKDGGLANNANLDFVLYNPEDLPHTLKGAGEIRTWSTIVDQVTG